MSETRIKPIAQPSNHSTEVEMALTLDDGKILSVGQIGCTFIILDDPTNFSPCEGEIMLSVDGSERSWRVSLPEGAKDDVVRTPIVPI